jgi:TRAP-type C4-dicarboxylate transport system permease small subunit
LIRGATSLKNEAAPPFLKSEMRINMRILKFSGNIFDRVLSLLMAIACIILAFVALSVCLEVILRYFFNRPQIWVIEFSEYALLYITFLGAAWVLKSGGHVTVDMAFALMSDKGRAVCSMASYMICFLVSTVLLVYGTRVTWGYYVRGLYNPTVLEIPTSAILIVIPIGGLTLLLQSIRGFTQNLQQLKEIQRK